MLLLNDKSQLCSPLVLSSAQLVCQGRNGCIEFNLSSICQSFGSSNLLIQCLYLGLINSLGMLMSLFCLVEGLLIVLGHCFHVFFMMLDRFLRLLGQLVKLACQIFDLSIEQITCFLCLFQLQLM